MGYWTDKVILITGGSAGLGLALAALSAKEGMRVAIAARGREQLEQAAEFAARGGREVFPCVADVTSQEDVERLMDQVVSRFGRLDVLVNNAGKSTRGRAIEVTPAEFQALWEINFLASVRCTRAAIRYLQASRGHLVNIGSLASKSASRFLGAYPATKFPLAAYSQQLRLELSEQGVHVLLVCPGPMARADAGARYQQQAAELPDHARRPGGGVRLKGLPPEKLAAAILTACRRRKAELVMPRRARLLFALSQLSPSLGDWILAKMTKSPS